MVKTESGGRVYGVNKKNATPF